jgi:hypothetical protein
MPMSGAVALCRVYSQIACSGVFYVNTATLFTKMADFLAVCAVKSAL